MTQVTGKVIVMLSQESGKGAKGEWIKQPFVIETTDQYPKKIHFEAWGKAANHAENLKVGQEITVHYNPESREYQGKWFTSLRAYKFDYHKTKQDVMNEPMAQQAVSKLDLADAGDDDSNLPF